MIHQVFSRLNLSFGGFRDHLEVLAIPIAKHPCDEFFRGVHSRYLIKAKNDAL